jgi:hypothetical protein
MAEQYGKAIAKEVCGPTLLSRGNQPYRGKKMNPCSLQ